MYETPIKATTLIQDIKNFDFIAIITKIKSYHCDWNQLGVSLLIGLFSGFLFKRYLKSFLGLVISGIVLIYILQYYGVITLDWARVHVLTGVEPTHEAAFDFVASGWEWIHAHKVISFIWGLGFLIGLHLS